MTRQIMPNRLMKAGQIVFKEGDAPDGLYYICDGTVEVSRLETQGQARVLSELGEGSVFGEMAIVNAAPRNATVTTKTDCGFCVITPNNFQHLVEQMDPVMRGVFRVLIVTIRGFLEEREAAKASVPTGDSPAAASGEASGLQADTEYTLNYRKLQH